MTVDSASARCHDSLSSGNCSQPDDRLQWPAIAGGTAGCFPDAFFESTPSTIVSPKTSFSENQPGRTGSQISERPKFEFQASSSRFEFQSTILAGSSGIAGRPGTSLIKVLLEKPPLYRLTLCTARHHCLRELFPNFEVYSFRLALPLADDESALVRASELRQTLPAEGTLLCCCAPEVRAPHSCSCGYLRTSSQDSDGLVLQIVHCSNDSSGSLTEYQLGHKK